MSPAAGTRPTLTGDRERNVLVTGGAGFVGSHFAERLVEDGHRVTVADDLSNGRPEWVPDGARFVRADLARDGVAADLVSGEEDLIVHLASRKAVNDPDPHGQFRANVGMTVELVEAAVDAGVDEFVFASSSTVYGEAPRPTPEDYAPLEPISAYGASKLACEGILSSAAHSHGIAVYNFRFANVVGPRLRGAVVPDFIGKLRENPGTLTVLGNGRQEKSYMHVEDCVDGMIHAYERAGGPVATYNLGTRTTTSVDRIAGIVADEMGLDPDLEYTGGDRGWSGDVPRMRLSIEKLAGLGWEPSTGSDRAVRRATRELLAEL